VSFYTENIFNLTDPDAYDCYIERYHSSFQVLRMRAERFATMPLPSENMIEFIFTGILYVEGSLNWSGANVCIAPREDCLDLLYRTKIVDNSTPDEEIEEMLDTYHLFIVVAASGYEFKFLGHHNDFAMNVIG